MNVLLPAFGTPSTATRTIFFSASLSWISFGFRDSFGAAALTRAGVVGFQLGRIRLFAHNIMEFLIVDDLRVRDCYSVSIICVFFFGLETSLHGHVSGVRVPVKWDAFTG